MIDNKIFDPAFDPTYDVISEVQIIFLNIFGVFKPGAIKCCFRIENRSSSRAYSGGGAETPPPPSAGSVREYLHRDAG